MSLKGQGDDRVAGPGTAVGVGDRELDAPPAVDHEEGRNRVPACMVARTEFLGQPGGRDPPPSSMRSTKA